MKANGEIRDALKKHNMAQWELADYMGISEYTLCKKLRKELLSEETERIISLIKTKAGEKR